MNTMKLNDKHYIGMLEVARGIYKSQQNNPNSNKQHLLKAQSVFADQDAIQKLLKDRQKPDQKKEKSPGLKKEGSGGGLAESKSGTTCPKSPEKVSKYDEVEQEMKDQQAQIDKLLSRYSASSMTLGQASRSLLQQQITKWAVRMKGSNSKLKPQQKQ